MTTTILHRFWPLLVGLWLLTACQQPEYSDALGPANPDAEEAEMLLQNGDLIFQTSLSNQSHAIQLATKSPYSHVGLLYEQADGSWCVYEAVSTVRCTDLDQWIKRGKDNHYVVKRLRQAEKILTPAKLQAMKKAGQQYMGTKYDLKFKWNNNRFYCSELVWKLYHDATGLELAAVETFGDMALEHPAVQKKIAERYGDALPLEEPVVTPAALFDSEHLKTVMRR